MISLSQVYDLYIFDLYNYQKIRFEESDSFSLFLSSPFPPLFPLSPRQFPLLFPLLSPLLQQIYCPDPLLFTDDSSVYFVEGDKENS